MSAEEQVISALKHPAVVAARRSLGRAGGRAPSAFLAEGRRMVEQALAAGAPVETLFFLARRNAKGPDLPPGETRLLDRARARGIPCRLLTRGVFFRLLGLGYETAVRVLAVVRRPASPPPGELLSREGRGTASPPPRADAVNAAPGAGGAAPSVLPGRGPCFLAGERIQDSRNVGVLVRTADAWALRAFILGPGGADPYSRQSVRSTTGSIFRMPVVEAADLVKYLEALKAGGVRLVGTSAGAALPCWEADLTGPVAVVVGNETAGLSPAVREACDLVVAVPVPGGAHSFNVTVAAGMVLYERARQAHSAAR